MRVLLTQGSGTRDITRLMASWTWSGDKASLSRQLAGEIAFIEHSGLPVPELGNLVTMEEDGERLFVGTVLLWSLGSESSTMSFTAFDYFYLYFSEWLNLQEIGELVGKDHTVILRALGRALRNIGTALGGREAVLKNPEALDELAYQICCDMAAHPERLPEGVPLPIIYTARHPPKGRQSDPPSSSPPASLRDLLVRVLGRPQGKKPPGKLLTALRRERPAYSLFHCLAELFRRLKETFK